MWYSADNSYFYISHPPPFVQSSAAYCLWLAAQITLGAAGRPAEPDREAEGGLKLLLPSRLSCAKFTSLTLGTAENEACHDEMPRTGDRWPFRNRSRPEDLHFSL